MTSPLRRKKAATQPAYVIVQETQHWRKIDGRWYRDAVVRLADGQQRLYAFPDEVAA